MIEFCASKQISIVVHEAFICSLFRQTEVVCNGFVSQFRVARAGRFRITSASYRLRCIDTWHSMAVNCGPWFESASPNEVFSLLVDFNIVKDDFSVVAQVAFFKPLGFVSSPRVGEIAQIFEDSFVTVHQLLLHSQREFNWFWQAPANTWADIEVSVHNY